MYNTLPPMPTMPNKKPPKQPRIKSPSISM
jgi:hypothetical protein